MRVLCLDFERQARGAALGYGLVISGVLAVGLAMATRSILSGEIEQYRAAAPRVASARDATVLPPGVASEADAIGGARAVAAHLAGPWEAVFRSLETTDVPDVALLALTPDTQARRIRIQAEARSLEAMLSYIRALGRSGAFVDVVLAEHEVRQADPQKPVRFSVIAAWGGP